MFATASFPCFACLLLTLSSGPAGDDKDTPDGVSEIRVSLRLNAIQASKALDLYERLAKRELELPDSIRAAAQTGDGRLPQYQQALTEVQADVAVIKKKLVALETERAKLTKRLKKLNTAEETAGLPETTNCLLERILERLGRIEKRMEKMERGR
jgi:hypothetical protein